MSSDDSSTDVVAGCPLLTVEEAARPMRIGRSKAYALAREYLDSGGTSGLPVIVFGPGCFRVPRWALMELMTTGRVVRLCDAPTPHEDRSLRG